MSKDVTSTRTLRYIIPNPHAGADATNELFGAIQALIVRTLLAVQPAMIQDRHCFEVMAGAVAAGGRPQRSCGGLGER